jgi:hypothetical protein
MKTSLFLTLILASSISYANSDQDKSLGALRAACNASNYWDNYSDLPDKDDSVANVARCYARGTELLIKGLSGRELVDGACKVVIYNWPKSDGAWKAKCLSAGYSELL